ncbi:hypothetical protein PIIN_08441 [Serendipita indica DSM 11827]|uniref:DUF6535 domain-containing protein n=1 Tax=Serendipita indica (strain DSM 11827) TaxID=1109443 RepID=G4TT46_SERID|nr:hypothetical protein PIIN_08441 [Serendipita indica DSM 11827]
MDVLLTFAGLFSAVLVVFIVETYKLLLPDQHKLTNELLISIGRNEVFPSDPLGQGEVTPSLQAFRINVLFFVSLCITLSSVLFTMLLKLWTSRYHQTLERISSQRIRARARQRLYSTIKKWGIRYRIAILSFFLQISLFLFLIGLVYFLFLVNNRVAFIPLSFLIFDGSFYAIYLVVMVSKDVTMPPTSQFFQVSSLNKIRRILWHDKKIAGDEETAGADMAEDLADNAFWHGKTPAVTNKDYDSLDVDVVVSVMEEADKSIERPIIIQCFETLMTLNNVATQDSSTFFRNSIMRNLHQALDDCLTGRQQESIQRRVEDATLLCRFLDWYLSLHRSPREEKWLRRRLTCTQAMMPSLLCLYGIKNDDIEAMLRGQIADCRLHCLLQSDSKTSRNCLKTAERIFRVINNASPVIWIPEEEFWDLLTRYLLVLTDCMSDYPHFSGDGQNQENHFIAIVEQVTTLLKGASRPSNYKTISKQLTDMEYVAGSRAQRWKTAIIDAIEAARESHLAYRIIPAWNGQSGLQHALKRQTRAPRALKSLRVQRR